MINSLQKKFCILFVILLTIIWLGILFLLGNTAYRNNLLDLKQDVLSEITDVKWDNFIQSRGAAADLDDIPYCMFCLDSSNEPRILFHTFTDKSDEELLTQGQIQLSNKNKFSLIKRYCSIDRIKHKKYLLLISGEPALQATVPTILFCVVLAVTGIIVFIICSNLLSHWMVKPIEDMIRSEKTFISNASHELKTPLAVISANTELLTSELAVDNKHLLYIQQETSRMISLVQKLLTLTRLDAPQYKESHSVFSVDEALFDIIYPMESVAYEKELSLETDIQENMKIDGNKEHIQTLISILLNNAISYTPKHGSIYIHAHVQNRKFYLSVANTGDAISNEIRDKLFERFFRADNVREDNGHFGLGLSIAKSIVHNHSGKISVDRSGNENIFSVTLPVTFHG